MKIKIAPESGVPIYKQIVEQVERLIRGDALVAGELLPSVRQLATELTVNPMTVSKAYSQLETLGLVVRLRGKGMAVAKIDTNANEAIVLLQPLIDSLLQQAEQLNIAPETLIAEIKKHAK